MRTIAYSNMPLDPSPFYAFTGAFVGLIEGFYSQLLQILSFRTCLVSSTALNHAPKPHVAIAYRKKRTVKPAPPMNPPFSAKPQNTAEPITPPTMTPLPSTTRVSEVLDGAPNNNAQKKKKRRPRKKTAANCSGVSSASANN